jgi:hypothetical protein
MERRYLFMTSGQNIKYIGLSFGYPNRHTLDYVKSGTTFVFTATISYHKLLNYDLWCTYGNPATKLS